MGAAGLWRTIKCPRQRDLMVINAAQAWRLHRGPRCLYQFEAVRAGMEAVEANPTTL